MKMPAGTVNTLQRATRKGSELDQILITSLIGLAKQS